jgi:diguanylate cyclase
MNTMPLLYVLMGLLFGTTLLAIGIALGVWMGKRFGVGNASQFAIEQQQISAALKNMANWTSDFAGDFSRYQSTMQSLTRDAADVKKVRTKEEVQGLLDRIVQANSQLQSRLDSAEEKLEVQTKQLAGYLTEARTDGLTGLANRKAFDQKLDESYAKWLASKKPFSLAIIDIDHFKKINDTYGHPAGDAVLREMSNRLREVSDEAIIIARYGGEEFAIIFDGETQRAASIMEKLRLVIAAKTISTDGHNIAITISTGVARIMSDERIGKLVRRSDEALYSAKTGGRNRVCVHSGVICEPFGNPGTGAVVPDSITLNATDAPPTTDELEHRVLTRLDRLISQESHRKE